MTGEVNRGPRNSFYYWSDDGLLTAMRIGDWKVVFAEQRAKEFDVWREQFHTLRIPKVFHLRRDPLSALMSTPTLTTIGGCAPRYRD